MRGSNTKKVGNFWWGNHYLDATDVVLNGHFAFILTSVFEK